MLKQCLKEETTEIHNNYKEQRDIVNTLVKE